MPADTDTDQYHIVTVVCRQQLREDHAANASAHAVMPTDLLEGQTFVLLQQRQVAVWFFV